MSDLLETLKSALKRVPGAHDYTVQVARSQTRRSYALFPYSAAKIWQEEALVILSERVVPEGATEAVTVPIIAIEAAIYTVPSSSTSLVYISKVDSTGLARQGSATRALASAFIRFHLEHPPHATKRVRIHIFARAQGQYLFPGSVDNKGKRVLDDKGLLRWWKATASDAATDDTSLHYLVPGLSEIEAMSYVPAAGSSKLKWSYGHPYTVLPSPLLPAERSKDAKWFEHIPAFPDDPKSRFLHSLTSSVIEPAGQEGDYDDVMLQLLSSTFTTGSSASTKLAQVDKDKDRERQRLVDGVPGGVEEFWERMAFRQECASGTLVGFFVIARGDALASTAPLSPSKLSTNGQLDTPSLTPKLLSQSESQASNTNDTTTTSSKSSSGHSTLRPHEGALNHSIFTSLWSSFHNVDYAAPDSSSLERIAERAHKWSEDLKRAILKGGYVFREPEDSERERLYDRTVFGTVKVDNPLPDAGAQKRPAIATVVNKMVPRKKVKKA